MPNFIKNSSMVSNDSVMFGKAITIGFTWFLTTTFFASFRNKLQLCHATCNDFVLPCTHFMESFSSPAKFVVITEHQSECWFRLKTDWQIIVKWHFGCLEPSNLQYLPTQCTTPLVDGQILGYLNLAQILDASCTFYWTRAQYG